MPQKELKKANFLIYEADKEKFLADLQNRGIFHITDSRSTTFAEENPDLTYDLIKEILIGIEELNRGEKTEYKFG